MDGGLVMEKRTNRSDHCQHLFHEISVSQDILSIFSNNDSILRRLSPYDYDERTLKLQDELRLAFWRVVDKSLNDKQKQIVEMIGKEGLTQQEAAKRMGINQSSIAKAIGSTNINGCYYKLKLAVFADPEINRILKEISDIQEDRW
jgi:DNA-directed RNA polymerase specialized sigma subunit